MQFFLDPTMAKGSTSKANIQKKISKKSKEIDFIKKHLKTSEVVRKALLQEKEKKKKILNKQLNSNIEQKEKKLKQSTTPKLKIRLN